MCNRAGWWAALSENRPSYHYGIIRKGRNSHSMNRGSNMLTQVEAKAGILEEWRVWSKGGSNKFAVDGVSFFQMLRQDKPNLLRFKCSGDPWQVVKGWIQDQY